MQHFYVAQLYFLFTRDVKFVDARALCFGRLVQASKLPSSTISNCETISMTISRADLNEQFAKFVTACSEFGEEWNLYTVTEHNDLKRAALQDVVEKNLDSLVLARKDFKASPDRQLITWDYHVLYSESYEVPVMYFNASYSSKLRRITRSCQF